MQYLYLFIFWFYLFIHLFLATPGWAQGLFPVLYSGIIPGKAWKPYRVLGMEPSLVVCKTSTLFSVLYICTIEYNTFKLIGWSLFYLPSRTESYLLGNETKLHCDSYSPKRKRKCNSFPRALWFGSVIIWVLIITNIYSSSFPNLTC